MDGRPYEQCSVHFVTIANLGPTKAFPKEIMYGWTIGNELPPEPSYQWVDSFLPNYILGADPKITPRTFLAGAYGDTLLNGHRHGSNLPWPVHDLPQDGRWPLLTGLADALR